MNETNKNEQKTDWPGIRLICVIAFLAAIQMFVIGMAEWPYMHEVDPEATSNFFGYVGSVSSLGHAICAPLMGYWSSATGQTKLPLIAGRLIAMVGCIIYLCVELFLHNRRYVMLICYTIFGISMSSISVMRGYIAKISAPDDRAVAVSMFGLATMFAVTIGPVFQLLFAPLSYPGFDLIPNKLRLNIYTGPIYIATIANIVGLLLIIIVFKEKRIERKILRQDDDGRKTSRAIAALTADMHTFSFSLAFTCIFIRMTGFLTLVTLHTTTAPLMMSVFGWSNTATVKVSSVTQVIVGILSLCIFAGFATGKLLKILSERRAALIGLALFGVFFILTYPWPFIGSTIPLKSDENNATGCDPLVYTWCLNTLSVNPIIYIGSAIAVLGIAITFITISTDSLYSKILGPIDQGTMQGIFLLCMDIINIFGPLIIA
ncbi:unnamed protein product [Dracunculus medinensis]|uniref:MFS domain-containing protein n=1 Tax=Dracunculus medinensis TaxID=318479 RepID=A0A0N4UBJ9_DRAME|nr:unnamed protein product [Dracunculus medinensis]